MTRRVVVVAALLPVLLFQKRLNLGLQTIVCEKVP